MQIKDAILAPVLVEESVHFLHGSLLFRWRSDELAWIDQRCFEVLFKLVHRLVGGFVLALQEVAFLHSALGFVVGIQRDQATISVEDVFLKLAIVQHCFVKLSAETLSLSCGIHLAEVGLVDDCDFDTGVDGEQLLYPVRLEVEWASDESQEAGELRGGLRCIEIIELVDQARLDNMCAHLVGDFLTAQGVCFSCDYSSRKYSILISDQKTFVNVISFHESSISFSLDDFVGVLVRCSSCKALPNLSFGKGLSFINAAQVLFLTIVLVWLKRDGSAGDQAGDIVRT